MPHIAPVELRAYKLLDAAAVPLHRRTEAIDIRRLGHEVRILVGVVKGVHLCTAERRREREREHVRAARVHTPR